MMIALMKSHPRCRRAPPSLLSAGAARRTRCTPQRSMRSRHYVALLGVLIVHSCTSLSCGWPRPHAARRPPLRPSPQIVAAIPGIGTALDEWFRTAPYQSAFCVTAFKATLADVLTQLRERRFVQDQRAVVVEGIPSGNGSSSSFPSETITEPMELTTATGQRTLVSCDDVSCNDVDVPIVATTLITCDELSCEEVEVVDAAPVGLSWRRSLAFFLYGGLYQGCAQYFIFNVLYPVWFGEGTDLLTIVEKVGFDQFVLTPFLCLPSLCMQSLSGHLSPLSLCCSPSLDHTSQNRSPSTHAAPSCVPGQGLRLCLPASGGAAALRRGCQGGPPTQVLGAVGAGAMPHVWRRTAPMARAVHRLRLFLLAPHSQLHHLPSGHRQRRARRTRES